MSNVEENQSHYFHLFRHFRDYNEKLIFLFFETNFVEYVRLFFCYEYYYWRIMHVNFSLKFGLFKYFFNPIFDYASYSRFLVGGYFIQRFLYKRKGFNKSIFLVYYIFLLYRDLILKSINSSFDFNLVFYFFFSKFYYLDSLSFLYCFMLNGNINFLNYMYQLDETYDIGKVS